MPKLLEGFNTMINEHEKWYQDKLIGGPRYVGLDVVTLHHWTPTFEWYMLRMETEVTTIRPHPLYPY